jgi:hypothetical protein
VWRKKYKPGAKGNYHNTGDIENVLLCSQTTAWAHSVHEKGESDTLNSKLPHPEIWPEN